MTISAIVYEPQAGHSCECHCEHLFWSEFLRQCCTPRLLTYKSNNYEDVIYFCSILSNTQPYDQAANHANASDNLHDNCVRNNPGSSLWVVIVGCWPSSELCRGRGINIGRHDTRSVMQQTVMIGHLSRRLVLIPALFREDFASQVKR